MRFDLHPWPSDESDWFGCLTATRWSSLCIEVGAEEKWERATVDHTHTPSERAREESERGAVRVQDRRIHRDCWMHLPHHWQLEETTSLLILP
jgi:hypothetical protein